MSYLLEDLDTETISSVGLQWSGATPEQLAFMRRVYEINLAHSSGIGTFIDDIPEDQLAIIENGHKAKIDAAAACRDLLAAARQATQSAGVIIQVGVVSGYRSATHQFNLWQSYFPGYYNDTTEHRSALPGGPHGDQAATYLAQFIRARIATPGFSNHQNGIAVDFLNKERGTTIRNSTHSSALLKWRQSWLWSWLVPCNW